jgi:hypothetical protein
VAVRRWFAGYGTAMLAGALTVFGLVRTLDPKGLGQALGLLVAGALYGLGVLGVLRLFRARGAGLLAAGLIAGPVPLAVLQQASSKPEDRAFGLVVAMLFGLALGALEWARSDVPTR